ncbi:MAG: DUF1062 domain-containing protein [Rhizobiaceae bacterium]|nr:DUF1062 domain-containing protein [Rhizobiaceae bacterium]
MCNILKVRWTIIPQTPPQPWIACAACGSFKPFRSSGKIRLNANGRRLDAWLVYKCSTCDRTWNRTIFERQTVSDLTPATLDALQSNDPAWIRVQEFDLDALRRRAQRIDEFADAVIRKTVLGAADDWTALQIELVAPFPPSLRLDRLLASELEISRSRLQALAEKGALRVHPARADAMRRKIRSGSVVVIDLSDEPERHQIGSAAITNRDTG